MFTSGAQYAKLKTNLRLAINRLKLLEKKKTEMAQKARKEIADYISINKEDRARIRVEHIIREDYTVEAFEILEMYCDLLLARFGIIQQMKELDEGIEEAVNSVLWAAPRLQSDIQELKVISDQLTAKYGKPFVEACRQNQLGKVNLKLMQKLGVQAPPKILVEKYMVEIAKSHGVPFEPDPNVMREDEIAAAEAMLIDFQNQGQRGHGWMYPGAAVPGGDQPSSPGFIYKGPDDQGGGAMQAAPPPDFHTAVSGQAPPQPFNYPQIPAPPAEGFASNDDADFKLPRNPGFPTAPLPTLNLPELPDPPSAFPRSVSPQPPTGPDGPGNVGPAGNGPPPGQESGNEPDFDDLTKRFEELKKRR